MDFSKVKENIIKAVGKDPFSQELSWELIEKYLDSSLWQQLGYRDGAATLSIQIPQCFTPDKLSQEKNLITCWERIGNFYKNLRRPYEALSIYFSLYYQLIKTQKLTKEYIHKGLPLLWISECYYTMGFPVHTKRYLMLTLIEAAIDGKGNIPPDTTGIYWRLIYRHGLSDSEFKRYASEVYQLWHHNKIEAIFPEWILQHIDKRWLSELPSPAEAGLYVSNPLYIKQHIEELGDRKGKVLEDLAEYILACMPGCRTEKRQITSSTDLDIVCSMEGFEVDFRSEFGRYFVCECKDWKKAADFSTIAKFCRVLDSIKARFGILFTTHGISGKGKNKDAELERLKIFQDRGMVIVVLDRDDFINVSNGENFINLLRKKYERVRLDIPKTK